MSKIRSDFVTNSSSSSFVLQKKNLSDKKLIKVLQYLSECGDWWDVRFGEDTIKGTTIMENGDIEGLFKKLKISRDDYFKGE
jgi:hypothetical protein